ncbi:MAG: hypothetical protein ACMXYA_00930 [Candidatus Woesearchaeota archaeon]
MSDSYIVLDIGGTKIHYCVVQDNTILIEKKVKTQSQGSAKDVISQISNCISEI